MSRSPKLLMTTDTIGGVWHYALDLARAFGGHGCRVALATMGSPLSGDQWRQVRSVPGLRVFESRFKLEWMQQPWDDVEAAGHWLLEVEERFRPDLVHLNNYAHGALPWRAPTVVVGHSCVYSWWRAVHGGEPPPEYDAYREAVREGLQSAQVVVAPSRSMLSEMERLYGPFADARVIHNGREPNLYRSESAGPPCVLAVGRLWDEAKNAASVAAVAHGLAWPVCLAGEARHPEGEAPVELPNARILGNLPPERLREHYAAAPIYAAPARYEPFGLSVLEAALSGCALVLGDIPSLRELWEGAALFVPPDDRRQLQRTLARLIDDDDLRERYQRRAQAHARRYPLAQTIDGYRALYREMLTADTTAAAVR